MNFKIFILTLLQLLTIHESHEGTASCSYKLIEDKSYTCILSAIATDYYVYDPNIVENFEEVTGEHVEGGADEYVTNVENSDNFNPRYFPKIVCEKFPQLQKIAIKNSEIEKIPHGSIDKCEHLEWLQISNSELKRIDDQWLGKCEDLSDLIIEGSKLQHVPERLFASCNKLKNLDLNSNRLKFLSENLFEHQHNLETLNLTNNKIQGFPKNFFKNLKNLQKLNLSNNSLSKLSTNWFNNLQNLQELNLSKNVIQVIPKSFFNIPNLKTLDLSSTGIQYIHADSFVAYPNVIILVDNIVLEGIEERFVKDILNANKTLKIYKTLCTRDRRVLFGHEFPENQNNEQLLEYLDNCFDEYRPRNNDEVLFAGLINKSYADSTDNYEFLHVMRDEIINLLKKLSGSKVDNNDY